MNQDPLNPNHRRLGRITRAALVGLALTTLIATTGCSIRGGSDESPTPNLVGLENNSEATETALADANAAREAGNYEEALLMFRQILAENPTITGAYLGIADVYMDGEDYERAEPVFRRAARLEPRNFDAQYGHGLALQMLGRFVEAIRAYQRALAIDPDSPLANRNIATSLLQINDSTSALQYAQRAVELAPDDGSARVNLGAILEQQGDDEAAIDEYIVAIELIDDDVAPVMMNLINCLAREKRYQEAANTAENLIRIEASANAWERLGWSRFRLQDYEGSTEAYRAAIDLDPSHWPSLNGLGVNALNRWLISDKQDVDARQEATEAFRRSLRQNSDQQRLITLMTNYGLR